MTTGRRQLSNQDNPYAFSLAPLNSPSYQPYNYHNSLNNSRVNPNDQIPSQSINLLDNVSFARNFKSRLYNADPKQEQVKHKVQDRYRQQLMIQMQEDKRRKAAKKAKQNQQDERLQRKFYQNIKIEAQKKQVKTQQPNYFMMRTNFKSKSDSPGIQPKKNNFVNPELQQFRSKDNLKRTINNSPKILKRGGYHNHSALDNFHAQSPQKQIIVTAEGQKMQIKNNQTAIKSAKVQQQEVLKQQMIREQQRISRLLLVQQTMLKKLDNFRKEILYTNRSMRLDQQLQKIKLKLRSKPLNMSKIYSAGSKDGVEDVLLNNSDLYHLPIIPNKHKIYEGDRQIKKQRIKSPLQMKKPIEIQKEVNQAQESQIGQKKKKVEVQVHDVFNDKNIGQTEQQEPVYQGNDNYD